MPALRIPRIPRRMPALRIPRIPRRMPDPRVPRPPTVPAVAFYVSGHGFGHASRQVEIINAFARRRPDAGVILRSSVSRALLDRTLMTRFTLDDRPVDTGVVQIDSLHLDAAATIAQARDFYATIGARAAAESDLLRAHDVRFVVADAPPLGCAAAAGAGIPSVVVSNFTWDWIYEEYREHLDGAPALIPTIQAAYRLADEAWRLPMHGGFETFVQACPAETPSARRRLDMPFVARHSTREPADTRRRLGLPADRRLVLPSFGAYGVQGIPLDDDALDLDSSWHVVRSSDGEIQAGGVRYEDLVRAADVVVTKPGYGIVAECVANGAALVYTSRGRFAEYPVLVREMPRYLRCAYLDIEGLLSGRWRAALEAAVSAPPPPERPRTDGAEVIADMIAARL
jgi:L-arabinokinase